MGTFMSYEDNKIPGWMSIEDLQWLHEMATKMKHIVEIGSWAGRSTHALLTGCSKGLVSAVDTWDQSTMEGLGDAANARFLFHKNLRKFDNLNIMEMTSIEAAKKFKKKSVDMVFIDGLHDEKNFSADVEAWLPIAKKIICGHDFSVNWPDVQKVVRQKFGHVYQVAHEIWYVDLTTIKGM